MACPNREMCDKRTVGGPMLKMFLYGQLSRCIVSASGSYVF